VSKTTGRICLECEHCYVYGGSPGYSDLTPAWPFEFSCQKKHPFKFGDEHNDKQTLIDDIRQAETCPDFKEEEKP
jgi:hypothetical protein